MHLNGGQNGSAGCYGSLSRHCLVTGDRYNRDHCGQSMTSHLGLGAIAIGGAGNLVLLTLAVAAENRHLRSKRGFEVRA